MSFARLARRLQVAFKAPTLKQKEAHGRFAHTLSAAAVIGAITIVFTEGRVTPEIAWRIAGLAVSAVICCVAGVLLVEGE